MRYLALRSWTVAALAAIGTVPSFAQFPGEPTGTRVNIPGTLELVDKPPSVTPVEFLMVTIRQLHGGYRFDAQPDHDGKFTSLRSGLLAGRFMRQLNERCKP